MFTGEDDINNMGKINTWDFQNRTHYPGHCGEIRGSANGFFPPYLEQNDTLEIFSHETCRTLTYIRNELSLRLFFFNQSPKIFQSEMAQKIIFNLLSVAGQLSLTVLFRLVQII